MIRLEEALEIINQASDFVLETEAVSIENAFKRILAEDVNTDTDIPAFDKSAMDGFACRREDLDLTLDVLELIAAGEEPTKEILPGQCSQIMTGAMLPKGADCVVMQEYVEDVAENKVIYLGPNTSDNILYHAEDMIAGGVLLEKGTQVSAQNMALLATAGLKLVKVYKSKKVAIVCTGSELVEAGEKPTGAKIRNTNRHQLAAQISSCGHTPVYFGIVPDNTSIKQTILSAIQQCDIIVITGGASVGKFDLVPEILKEIGFDLKFRKVGIQPGKPVSFSVLESKFCFGLSGNPVSSFLQFELLARPFLQRLAGSEKNPIRLKLKFDGIFKRKNAERKFFLPVTVANNGRIVNPEYHGSAHLHALNGIFGFAEIPEGQYELKKGDKVYVRPL